MLRTGSLFVTEISTPIPISPIHFSQSPSQFRSFRSYRRCCQVPVFECGNQTRISSQRIERDPNELAGMREGFVSFSGILIRTRKNKNAIATRRIGQPSNPGSDDR